ncbi:two-component system response regulator YesN [Paenibacillus anaericanus]|uniref:response regulator transcription factor n=1 Tax=Paenibacillus anaericanus TaxID=170367 RepID=UPI0027828AAE|nr:response regulator [Paenibacillus anaericanus]MDQ0088250.1 two-component system response regulator YesN [Paenibacillus anaericanus]
MRLKALLVDDEVHILNNLSKVLPWEDMDIEIVSLAKNGVDALNAAIQHEPDLILSDIRMPVMDGMTLLQEIRNRGLTCEILLLTGYQEFEYAKTAIRHGVKDYICKPINYFELEETVRNIAGQIREKRKKQNKEQKLNRVAYLANENYMLHSLLGQETEEEGVLWDEEDGLANEKRYAVLLLDLEGYAHRSISWTAYERKAWNLQIKNMLKDIFSPILKDKTVLQIREGEWCVIFPSPERDSRITKEQLYPGLIILQTIIDENAGMSIRMSLEQNPFSLKELSMAYQRMQKKLILNPSSEWFLDTDTANMEYSGPELSATESKWLWIEKLSAGLRNGNQESLVQITQELKSFVGHFNENSVGQSEKLLHYLLIHLLREMRELQMLSGEQEENIWQRLQESLSLKELLSLIVLLIERSRDSLSTKKSSELLMMSAQNYIQHNLENDFGIEDISEYLGISCSYFCLLFKNQFGETFVEYLTKQRMEVAKTLIISSDKSITQIGSAVGYHERRYFTKVFQKYTGMTPSEFRLKDSTES